VAGSAWYAVLEATVAVGMLCQGKAPLRRLSRSTERLLSMLHAVLAAGRGVHAACC
jgi:hypothetical protein